MSSFNGLKRIAATSIQNTGPFILGNQLDAGTAGQVIVSNGANESATWGTNSAVLPNALTMGTDLSLASGNPSFDGSVADTINAAGHGFGSGGNGIDITGTTITTDNDGTTINNTGGTGDQNQVLKVPNALTSGSNVSFSAGTTYDGSAAITISATDTNTTYTAGNGIDLFGTIFSSDNDGTTINNTGGTGTQNQVLKVPNSLTAGTNITFSSGTTYDGSSAITINATDTNTTYSAGDGIEITGGNVIKAKPDEDTIDFDGDELTVVKVPEALSAGNNLDYSSGSTFDGETARTINLNPALTNVNLTDSTNIIHPPNVFDYAGDLRMSIEMGNFYPNDDSSYFNIGVEDDFSASIHGTLKPLTSSLEVCGYFIIPANYTATACRIDINNASGVAVSRVILTSSITTYGSTGYTSLGSGNSGSEFTFITNMAGASDKIMLIQIYTTSTADHIRGGYIKLTR